MTNEEQSQADKDAAQGRRYQVKLLPRAARLWRWAFMGVAAATILLSALILSNLRPSPAPDANVPAVPAQPGGDQPGGVQPAGGQPGGDDLVGCRLDDLAVSVAVRDVESQTGLHDALNNRWFLVFTNESTERLAIAFHVDQRRTGAEIVAWAGWEDGWQEPAAGEEYAYRSEWTRYPDGNMLWDYVDGMAVFRATPACSWIGGDEAALEKLTNGVPKQPIGE